MLKFVKALIFCFFSIFLCMEEAFGQCAMCRTTIENNVSQGEGLALGAGLNTGILFLFFTPYVVIGVVGMLWYKKSKENASKLKASRNFGS